MPSKKNKVLKDIQDPFAVFKQMTFTYFNYLMEDFSFKHVSTEINVPECAIKFRNKTTGVTILCELGANVWVELSRLLIRGHQTIEGETYGLNLLIIERCPEKKRDEGDLFPERINENINKKLEEQAIILKECAYDVLTGEFSVFAELKKIAEAERRRINKDLFGSESGETY